MPPPSSKKKNKKKPPATKGKKPTTTTTAASDASSSTNKPANHIILDATKPFEFTYRSYGCIEHKICVHQQPDEETWPGGALWDLGVILAKLLVALSVPRSSSSLFVLPKAFEPYRMQNWKDAIVLELGCGVGLTGLVAASLGAKVTILTDLEPVVAQVTQPNVERNFPTNNKKKKQQAQKTNKAIIAMPLCWGVTEDERKVQEKLKGFLAPSTNKSTNLPANTVYPDWILVGDVAYQHKPGAPSHFDALLSTLLKFVGPSTKVLFGTRCRMPASQDLLIMFQQHFHPIVPQVDAHEIDPSLNELGRKHNMTIHLFQGIRPENAVDVTQDSF